MQKYKIAENFHLQTQISYKFINLKNQYKYLYFVHETTDKK